MADRLVITIDGDASGLIKTLESTERRLNSFNTRISNSSRALTNMMKTLNGMNSSVRGVTTGLNQITQALGNATSRINSFTQSMNNMSRSSTSARHSVGGLNTGIRDLILAVYSVRAILFTGQSLFGGVLGDVIETNSQFEKMQVLLKNVAGGASEMENAVIGKSDSRYIWNLADNAPFKIEALTKSFVKLKASGIDPTQGTMQALVDTVAFFGGSTDEMNRAGIALSQMLSKGKVTAEELRQQLGDAIPNAMKDMAEALDMTIPELDAKMRKGLVLSADAVPKLMELWSIKYKGGAENMMATWDGLMVRMQNAWQKMILRVTSDGGSNSFFNVIKKEVSELTEFLNSASGDQFMREVTEGLGTVAIAFSNAIKFVYEYREEIALLLKVAAGFFAFNAATSIIRNLGSVFLGGAGTIIKFLTPLTQVKMIIATLSAPATVAARATIILGEAFTAAATAMGIFNRAGAISLAALAAVAAEVVLVGAAIGGLIYFLTRKKEATQRDIDASIQHEMASKNLKNAQNALEDAFDKVRTATAENRAERVRDLNTIKNHTVELMKNAKAALANARARMVGAQMDLNDAKKKEDAERKENGGMLDPGWGGINLFKRYVLGQKTEYEKATDNLNFYSGETQKYAKELQDSANLVEQATIMVNSVDLTKGVEKQVAAVNTNTKDKLGSLDSSRNQLVNFMMKVKELNAELATTPENDAIGNFNDNREEIEAEVRAYVAAIKVQSTLNAETLKYKNMIPSLKEDVKKHKDEITALAKAQQNLERLQTAVNDQNLQAQDALGSLEVGYSNVSNQVDRYIAKLRQQYSENLKSTNQGIVTKTQEEINKAAHDRRLELMALEAKKAQESTIEINDALLTEDQQREANYQREVARIQGLIDETQNLYGPEGRKIADQYYNYLKALAKKNNIAQSMFGSWAQSAADLKGQLGSTLTSSMDSFIDGLARGKLAFGDFVKSLLIDITKIIIRALIAKAILSAIGLGYSGSNNFAADGLAPIAAFNSTPTFHRGGTVGSGSPGRTTVDPAIFAFAERYHTGGMVGLKPNEVPIIAEKGETVLTPEQMKAMGSSGSKQAPETTVNIINQSGTQMDATSSQPRFDGEKMIIDVILKNMSKPGPLRDSMKGMK